MKSYSPCFFVFACICINHVLISKSETDDSYTKHCSSIIPRYSITTRSNGNSLPSLSTSHFTGGDRFLRMDPSKTYYNMQKNLRLRLHQDYYETTAAGVYEIQGFLHIRFPHTANDAAGGRRRNRGPLTFPMYGFWSEKSRKLCMVGSASWGGVDLDAVLKLKFADANPTIYNSVVSGSLESTASADDGAYFDPILIFSFPEASNYDYSPVLKRVGGAVPSQKDESLSLDSTEFCSATTSGGLRSLDLEYAVECTERRRCSPVGFGDEFLPDFISLTSIQCTEGAKKARFFATFFNYSSYGYDKFYLGSTVIGEMSWDDKNNRIIGVACRILNPTIHFGDAVEDCTTRLSLRYPSALTMRNYAKIVGQIWSTKAADDSGYFTQINLTATDDENRELGLPEQSYEYTELDRARKSCTAMKRPAKKGKVYPDDQSYDMRFDMMINNGKGQAFVSPVWVENDPFQFGSDILFAASQPGAAVSDAAHAEPEYNVWPTRMSYNIRIYPSYNFNSSLNVLARNSGRGVEIRAEGLYDARTGHLCMVGCRKLFHNSLYTSKDCEVVAEFELPPLLNGETGGLTKGIIRSTRPKTDALHFDDLVMESAAYNRGEAERSIWRMDVEIVMVLISSTLLSIFVALQIFHVKRNPEVPSFVSLVMLVVLSAGHTIPLVLNFEAVFTGERGKQTLHLGSGGRLEANEVAVRVITLVALLLQLRLLQLVWTAKRRKSSLSGEKKVGFVSLSLYILGGLLTLLLRKQYSGGWISYYVWGDLRSYAGVILDGFLVPQILLNIFGGLTEKALSHGFYIGTSMIRLMPHAYNHYRSHNYPSFDLNQTYYYANPAADFYSAAWDIIIPCGIIALAVIVFVQQRHGGRCILPRRLRACQMYEELPPPDIY